MCHSALAPAYVMNACCISSGDFEKASNNIFGVRAVRLSYGARYFYFHSRECTMKRTLMMLVTTLGCMMSASAIACPELLKHKFMSLQGDSVDLCAFEKRPILVVNTASKCGYTPQL